MGKLKRLILVALFVAGLFAVATPAEATCNPGRISVKPLVIEFPQCYPPGGGPVGD